MTVTEKYLLKSLLDLGNVLEPNIPSRISSVYGPRDNPFGSRIGGFESEYHYGVDIATYYGMPVYASHDGYISFSGWRSGYGKTIILDGDKHISYQTKYAHLSKIVCYKGQYITNGQYIGEIGSTGRSTGDHLHYEVILEGYPVDPSLLTKY